MRRARGWIIATLVVAVGVPAYLWWRNEPSMLARVTNEYRTFESRTGFLHITTADLPRAGSRTIGGVTTVFRQEGPLLYAISAEDGLRLEALLPL